MILHATKRTLILAIACAVLGCAVRQVRTPPSDADRVAALTELTLSTDTGSQSTVGVTPLAADVVDTTLTALGYGLADLLITDLARSARLRVVDRTRMDALFRELSLASSERADSVNAPRIGRFVGARRLVSGSLTQGGEQEGSLRLSARILDVQTASLVGRPIDAITDLSHILDAEKELALRIFEEMGVTLTPAERAAVEERPTRDIAAFLAYSRGVRDEAAGRFDDAAAEYGQAIQLDPDFAVAGQRLQRVRSVSRRGSSLARTGGRSRAHSGRLRGVLDGVNPSPASRLGRLRDHGQDNARAALQSSTMATVILFINTLP